MGNKKRKQEIKKEKKGKQNKDEIRKLIYFIYLCSALKERKGKRLFYDF
ncbi:hypothetical protein LJC08_02830 [Methanimicrococcus sp. OttesenSCG-928-J09]|nr:hypothetical protein [Methanimicrococcus sp. OttesenSCG-928-J09]